MFCETEGNIRDGGKRKPSVNPAQSETPGTPGNSMRENRETPSASAIPPGAERSEKGERSTSDMYAVGESDDPIVPAKRANKTGPSAVAESVEGRGSTKGNALAVGHAPDTAPDPRVDRRQAVRPVARSDWFV